MKDKIKIYLPTNTDAYEIFHIIYKLTDIDSYKESINFTKINENLPCSVDNPWSITFFNKEKNLLKGYSSDKTIQFIDQADNIYEINYLIDKNEKPHKGVSLILDSSAGLAVIGKRIVDFFSGEMFLAIQKGMEIEESELIHSSPIASFTRLHPHSHNYSYQNALDNVKKISADELLEFKKNKIWAETDYSLIFTIDSKYSRSYFEMQDLENSLHHNQESNTKKLKV
jgi:hypothetical protein